MCCDVRQWVSIMERVTSIIGAGAPLGFTFEGLIFPSTNNITRNVIQPYKSSDGRREISIPKDIYDVLTKTLPPDCSNDQGEKWASVNFEMIFHVLESYLSFGQAWKGNKNKYTFPVFGPFTLPSLSFDYDDISVVMHEYIIRIMDIVHAYNEYYRCNQRAESWYRDFFVLAPFKWDIFNFNYDTTIEDTLGEYEDGYEPISASRACQRFNPLKLWKNRNDLSTVNHLHGCIDYYYSDSPSEDEGGYRFNDLFKYEGYDAVRKRMVAHRDSHSVNQDGTVRHASPILTGLRKTDKLNCLPFDFYHGNLYNCLIRNRGLIIVGYSFGDLYMNQVLERMVLMHGKRMRIVLIDKWNVDGVAPDAFETYGLNNVPLQMRNFISKVVGAQSAHQMARLLQYKGVDTPMVSSNGCLMLMIAGFKQATICRDEIYSFLHSD